MNEQEISENDNKAVLVNVVNALRGLAEQVDHQTKAITCLMKAIEAINVKINKVIE
jgi:hypothetical protein